MFNKRLILVPWLLLLAVGSLHAATYTPGYTSSWYEQSGDFKVGDKVGGWGILDYHDAGTKNSGWT